MSAQSKFKYGVLALLISAALTGCGLDGDDGAQGETGAQGPQGADGAQGPQGDQYERLPHRRAGDDRRRRGDLARGQQGHQPVPS